MSNQIRKPDAFIQRTALVRHWTQWGGVTDNQKYYTAAAIPDEIRIRKLTPKECFRLQGFPDEYFERAASVCSDSQLYKQAGNSVTVNVIYEIAKRLKTNDETDGI